MVIIWLNLLKSFDFSAYETPRVERENNKNSSVNDINNVNCSHDVQCCHQESWELKWHL